MPPTEPPAPNPIEQAYAWFRNLPIVTRALFGTTIVTTVLGNVGIVPIHYFLLIPAKVLDNFELWRLLTCFFVNKLGFGFLMQLYFLYEYSHTLEVGVFAGRHADYLWFILFSLVSLSALGMALGLVVLGDALLLAIVYLWSQSEREREVSFYFGMRFKALYFPWVLVAFDFLTGDGFPMGKMCGILAGHAYYYLDTVYPQSGGQRWIQTPGFIQSYFAQRQEQQAATSAWGRGRKLKD